MKKPFYKKWWFWVIVVVIVAAAAGGSEDDKKTNSTTDNPKQEAKATSDNSKQEKEKDNNKSEQPKELSKEGESSNVKITVGGTETLESVGNEYSNQPAQGIFKVVEISITNNQKDAITINGNNFKLVDNQDREFKYSTQAQITYDITNEHNSNFFLKQLNPGLTQTGKIVFDVPKEAQGLVLKARGGMTGKEITLKID
ncbi:DUF4352 domain-containing protein [Bacillus cereus]